MISFSISRVILHQTIAGLSALIKLLKVGSDATWILMRVQRLPVQTDTETTRCHLLETVSLEAPELTLSTTQRR